MVRELSPVYRARLLPARAGLVVNQVTRPFVAALSPSLCGTCRHAAAHGNHLRVRELMEEKGVEVDARDRDGGRTSLHWACKNADVPLIKYLLGRGADINAPDGVRRGVCWCPRCSCDCPRRV